MEMHQIRYFLAVCRTLNFTRAAEECNVAQPSLTRAVQKLEEELGGPLFYRERANTHLTELGRLMQPHLEATFSAAQAAKDLATDVRKGKVASLRLGIDLSVPLRPVGETLSRLYRSLDGVELTLGAGTRCDVLEQALDGEYDLIVASLAGEMPERLRSWVLFRERCQLIVPKDHKFANLVQIGFGDLDDVALVTRTDCCLKDMVLKACAAAGSTPHIRHTAASETQLQELVLSGFGLGIHPRSVPLQEGLVALEFEGQTVERDVVLAAVAGRRFSLATDAFVKIARATSWQMH